MDGYRGTASVASRGRSVGYSTRIEEIRLEEQPMKSEYTAVIKQEDDWWIGWIEEIPGVNCQERTRPELLASLRETLTEAIELNRQDAIAAAGTGFVEEIILL